MNTKKLLLAVVVTLASLLGEATAAPAVAATSAAPAPATTPTPGPHDCDYIYWKTAGCPGVKYAFSQSGQAVVLY